jgi:hypothetical protein
MTSDPPPPQPVATSTDDVVVFPVLRKVPSGPNNMTSDHEHRACEVKMTNRACEVILMRVPPCLALSLHHAKRTL